MSRSLVVLPDDSAKPILDAIHGAAKSLRIKMFVFTDPSLLAAVVEAHRRGVVEHLQERGGSGDDAAAGHVVRRLQG